MRAAGTAGGAASHANHEDEHRSIGTTLLADIQEIFESERAERIFTADLLHALHAMEERPGPNGRMAVPSARASSRKSSNPMASHPKPCASAIATKKAMRYPNSPMRSHDTSPLQPRLSQQTVTNQENQALAEISMRHNERHVTDQPTRKTALTNIRDGVTGGVDGVKPHTIHQIVEAPVLRHEDPRISNHHHIE